MFLNILRTEGKNNRTKINMAHISVLMPSVSMRFQENDVTTVCEHSRTILFGPSDHGMNITLQICLFVGVVSHSQINPNQVQISESKPSMVTPPRSEFICEKNP